MASANSSYPYNYDPNGFIVSALSQPANYTPPASRPLPSAQIAPQVASYFGPNHQALTQMLQGALLGQAGAPGMAQQMTGNPALAQRLGGFGPGNQTAYTPPMPAVNRVQWGGAIPQLEHDFGGGLVGVSPNGPSTQGSGGFFGGGM